MHRKPNWLSQKRIYYSKTRQKDETKTLDLWQNQISSFQIEPNLRPIHRMHMPKTRNRIKLPEVKKSKPKMWERKNGWRSINEDISKEDLEIDRRDVPVQGPMRIWGLQGLLRILFSFAFEEKVQNASERIKGRRGWINSTFGSD